jgi:hypothetical protein
VGALHRVQAEVAAVAGACVPVELVMVRDGGESAALLGSACILTWVRFLSACSFSFGPIRLRAYGWGGLGRLFVQLWAHQIPEPVVGVDSRSGAH